MSKVIVDASACRVSGALTILNQFVDNISRYGREHEYVIFVPEEYRHAPVDNVRFVHRDLRGKAALLKRMFVGIDKRWMEESGMTPDVVISMFNLGTRSDARQIVYFHQFLTLDGTCWNPFKKDELKLFYYKNIFGWFVGRFITPLTTVVVQTRTVKDAFIRRFRVGDGQVAIVRPDVKAVDWAGVPEKDFGDGLFHLVYPATAFVFKNHRVLVEAMRIIKDAHPAVARSIRIHFTVKKEQLPGEVREIVKYGIEDNFVFHEFMPYDELLSYYKSASGLLFPSYIETFGMPLIEAAGAGLRVLASDEGFAHEVLDGYGGVGFVSARDAGAWAEAITGLYESGGAKCTPMEVSTRSEWMEFFKLIKP